MLVELDDIDLLRAAREVIADPSHWCKGTDAMDEDGKVCSKYDNAAVRFCANGAVRRARMLTNANFNIEMTALDTLRSACPLANKWEETPDFNDRPETTHSEVLAVFDRAIAGE